MKQRVLLKGADVIDLLHRISSLDLKHIEFNQKKQGLLLNPQGKILSYFETILTAPNALQVEFEGSFLEILEQYTFAEQYTVEKLAPSSEDDLSEKDRILNLTPKMGNEFQSTGETNPLEVNLKTAISDQKGCYPGQEVIEKIIAIGSPAKKLCLLEGTASSELKLPAILLNAKNEEAGILTSYADGVGLAILKRTQLKEGIELFHSPFQFTLKKVSS